ncbi:hypothetical protein JCM6882_002814 [Rhodosporidiobolus microsporus]
MADTAAAPPSDELAKLKLGQQNGAPALGEDKAAEDAAEDDDDEDEGAEGAATGAEKKKPKKKKKAATVVQTEPPTIPVSQFFKSGNYPEGERQEYLDDNSYRTTSEEKRAEERRLLSEPADSPYNPNAARRAAEVHRQVRHYARNTIKPGMSMTEIANLIEDGTRALVEAEGFASGIGFPTGLSRNFVAAHYTPNAGDKIVLQAEDVLKVDFGVHVNGRIVDSAFTMNFEPTYDNLLAAVKDATNTGVRTAGIDVRMGDIGAAIQEVMESYEVEVGGKTLQVKSIRNLTGHSIEPYSIHGKKSVPIIKLDDNDKEANVKMEEGEYFAIETFGSTGEGIVRDYGTCSHYSRNMDAGKVPLRLESAKKLLGTIDKNFRSIPWCRRYLDRLGCENYAYALKHLVDNGLVNEYPPLADYDESAQTAQYEHTILLRPTCKEVISRGDDY